ncbi:carboxylating nicotinate-nucleotide diphosphorylase [Flectobacillus sp. DC10W]|jgi:nicotinate-nucleotide pyrophosphorylase (carboxylating)|uniref:nicotinate-nucleotide diphosphorylase (carboxylating) n=1 Tax=Flectobacillus longus TaxID=2984207 RepID=A0ABT6YU78_9BACT|nr:carboxylating nicotinate-nucleotide diphosphorylase [Flectobacillus longus]MDI9867085.1 carboxylating nicotinate-nucleotide diphosphorylase [Flectobacillus longus]
MFNYLEPTYIKNFIQNALTEDVGDGDHTSLSTVPHDAIGRARLLVKDKGILAGVELAKMIFAEVDPELQVTTILEDGTSIDRGQIVLTVEGRSQSILKAERLVLNCMQRMSGIATYTRSMVNLIEGTNAKLLDTRKTTPNFRLCEKWACKIGGAVNHRYALFDMILIKDNHVDYAGGIANAILQANEYLVKTEKNLQIEIEVRNLEELQQVLAIGQVNRIMLDNFSFENLREAVRLIDGKYLTEASGGINETTIRQYAECGVDYISSGALTHQIKSLDLSLKAY